MKSLRIGFILLIFVANLVKAQDPQRSQYYAIPLELNPAYVGTSEFFSSYLNYRVQYPSFVKPWTSYHFAGDYHFQKTRRGIGLSLNSFNSGPGNLRNTAFSLMYSTGVALNRKLNLRMGLKAGLINRRIGIGDLVFADQLNAKGQVNGASAEPIEDGANVIVPSVGAGLLMYHENYWLGFAADHLNNPDQSFTGEKSNLPPRFVIHTGYKFGFLNSRGRVKKSLKEFSMSPMMQYKMQGPSQQFDIGIHTIFEPLLIGVWYRGIPLPSFEREGIVNQDALSFLFGLKLDNFRFHYSYDLGIGSLANNNRGAHELTISLKFAFYKNGILKSYPKMLPMPVF